MKKQGFIYAIAAAVSWGAVYAIDQKILSRVSPLGLLFIDSVLTALVILPIMLVNSGSMKTVFASGKTSAGLIIVSLLLAALANFFIYSAIRSLGASTASIFEIAYPLFVVIFAFLLFKQTVSWYFALGACLIFAGSIIIIKFS